MNHFGSLILKKSMKDLETILINGKLCLTKSDKIEKPLTTVKPKKHSDQLLLITDLYSTKSILNMIHGTIRSLTTLVRSLEKHLKHFSII
jgi:hypothetical protein